MNLLFYRTSNTGAFNSIGPFIYTSIVNSIIKGTSLSSTFILSSHVYLWAPTLEWGLGETWYASQTWLACFLLATTVTGGEDCKEEAGLCISAILTNLIFYPHYEVWTSMAPLFGRMEEGDSSFYNV